MGFKLLPIKKEYIFNLIARGTKEYFKIESLNLPKDAKVKDVQYDLNRGCFMFKVFSKEYEDVKLGAMIPLMENIAIEILE